MILVLMLSFVFVVGACVGSFLNVAIARLPLEKSLLWPGSRCGACLQSIHWYDNLPLISYLWLRGRCRTCGQSFSALYLLIELSTALGFVALFWIELVVNVHDWPGHRTFAAQLGVLPWTSWLGFAWHAVLFSFLVVASVCDLQRREIPLQLTLTGTLIGLVGALLMPWPFPQTVDIGPAPANVIHEGIYAWPFWLPLPAFCGSGGNWQTGLLTGVLGALIGTFLLRSIGFIFGKGLGKEALGLGDADLMMMVGAFLGWQIVVVAFFLSPLFALIFGIIQLAVNKDNSLPFGPFLSLSVMMTCLSWNYLGAKVQPFFFWFELMFWGCILCAGVLYLMSFMLRLLRQAPG
jgi:leader peptidase (prepilin peptidase)/N-methyltransferase